MRERARKIGAELRISSLLLGVDLRRNSVSRAKVPKQETDSQFPGANRVSRLDRSSEKIKGPASSRMSSPHTGGNIG